MICLLAIFSSRELQGKDGCSTMSNLWGSPIQVQVSHLPHFIVRRMSLSHVHFFFLLGSLVNYWTVFVSVRVLFYSFFPFLVALYYGFDLPCLLEVKLCNFAVFVIGFWVFCDWFAFVYCRPFEGFWILFMLVGFILSFLLCPSTAVLLAGGVWYRLVIVDYDLICWRMVLFLLLLLGVV